MTATITGRLGIPRPAFPDFPREGHKMAKTLYEIRVFPKGVAENGAKRGTLHPDNNTRVFLVRAASVSMAMIALEADEDMLPASEVGRIEVNHCTRYTKFIGAQESI